MNIRLLAITPALLAAIVVTAMHSPVRPPASAAFAILAPQDPTVGAAERALIVHRSLAVTALTEEPDRPPEVLAKPVPAVPGSVARLAMPRLGIDNPIEDTLVLAGGQMDTPHNGVYGVGWYPAFSQPGSPGNAIFSAHETWNRNRGPFYLLHTARTGDQISVIMTDGRVFTYEVLSNVRHDVHHMDMSEIIWPSSRPPRDEYITLITCGGRIVYNYTGFGEYLDRDVVTAKRVS